MTNNTHPNDLNNITERCEALIRIIDDAILQAVQGSTIEGIDALETQVRAVCEEVSGSSPDDARNIKPRLAEMVGSMNELAQILGKTMKNVE